MKIALLTDTHWGARGDNIDLRNSMAQFCDDIFFPTIKEQNVEHIIHLGDLVDRRKYINIRTLNMMNEHFLQRINVPMNIIAGNHDTYYKNTNLINSLDEIIGENYPNILVHTEPEELDIGDTKFLLLPWINEDNEEETAEMIANSMAPFVMGHLELVGFQMIKGMVCTHGHDHTMFKKFMRVFTGHFHLKSTLHNIYYLGSPYAMNWSEAEDPHGFHILDTDTLDLQHIINPANMFVKLFYDAETDHADVPDVAKRWVRLIVKEKPDPYRFDAYVKSLQDQEPIELNVVEPIIQVSEDVVVSEADDTEVIIDKTIDARYDLEDHQKEDLKTLMRGLYREASDLIIER